MVKAIISRKEVICENNCPRIQVKTETMLFEGKRAFANYIAKHKDNVNVVSVEEIYADSTFMGDMESLIVKELADREFAQKMIEYIESVLKKRRVLSDKEDM